MYGDQSIVEGKADRNDITDGNADRFCLDDVHAKTFCDVLRARAMWTPDKRAFVFLNSAGAITEELSFATLDWRARQIAVKLLAKKLSGERVLLMFPPGLDFVVAIFACFYAGAVAVPVPFLAGKRIVERVCAICRDTEPAGVLSLASLRKETDIAEVASAMPSGLVWIEVDERHDELHEMVVPAPRPEALALLQYTSGSTRSPKGVMLSHANLMANNRMIADAFGHDHTTRGVSWLPLFHDMGLVGHVLQPVYCGGLSVLMSPLSFLQRPVRWLQAISSWKAATSGGPTYAYELCLKAVREEHLHGLDLTSWATAYCGSEKVRTDVLEEFSARFAPCGLRRQAIRPCFGLAEATLLVSMTDPQEELTTAVATDASSRRNRQAANCGRPARETSVIIVDPDSRTRVEDGVVGEIWIQGPHVALGYWNAANVAEESFQQRLADGSGAYLRTGDLGFLRNGQLFVVGRLKDTIIINGLKHSAEDIESTAVQGSRYFAGFTGAAFAIDREGHEHAMLVQEIGRSRCDVGELDRAVEAAFAQVTRDHGIRLFDFIVVRAGSLPRTSSGKVRRSHTREMYLANRFERLNTPPFACYETLSGRKSV